MLGKIETRVGLFVLGALVVFAYMGFQVGAFRFDRSRYNQYTMYFKDVSGLSRKADVKIAGVKVGWVENITLVPDAYNPVEAQVMVMRDYKLYSDSHAIVRQDGLLGPKYLEVIPGDPLQPTLASGDIVAQPSIAQVSVDELMQQFKRIAHNVELVTDSLKTTIGGPDGAQQLKSIMNNIQEASSKMASFMHVLEGSINRNEQKLDALFEIGEHVKNLSEKLQQEVLPAFTDGVHKISNTFDQDFRAVAGKVEATAQALEEASVQVRDGFRNITSVVQKIDEGKGLVGKLINEEETYRDLKVAVNGIKNYFAKVDTLQIVFDAHSEAMYRPAETYRYEDNKGYFDIRIHPTEDRFYVLQLASSEKGYYSREVIEREYFDRKGNLIPEAELRQTFDTKQFFREDITRKQRYTYKVGIQFGKIFNRVAFRFGLFENTPGVGVDFDIPLGTNKARWVTTFEIFEMNGWNRQDDRRPHLKWLNRIFALRNVYLTFGADDFVSKRNANGFVGFGLRFGDDDFKYLISSFSWVFNSINGCGSTISA